ncbi:methylamine utilization protein MauE [Duganella sp. FT80W]|uniref:Methylamine utilization protein MauE n=1 Tax=Duganella guangzhouensis TaxID=2666084 RepID=A0A6I2KXT3_9BURK|nr:MauE/DoxX family redox-associated membrane protein [Duganella guangzhouensis]MRW89234.1 methylamine utilization protein MauE [Duganella guangzhouensis]
MPALMAMLALAVSSFLLMLFAFALLHKASGFARFTGFVAAYRILPTATVGIVSALLILVETVTVALLVWAPLRAVGLYSAAALLLLYGVAIGWNVRRGRTHIDCGCGGPAHAVSAPLALRNLCLALGAGMCAAVPTQLLDQAQAAVALAAGVMAWLIFQLASIALSILHRAGTTASLKNERTSS